MHVNVYVEKLYLHEKIHTRGNVYVEKLYLHEKIHMHVNVYVEKLYDFMQVCIFNFDIMLKYELIKSFIN